MGRASWLLLLIMAVNFLFLPWVSEAAVSDAGDAPESPFTVPANQGRITRAFKSMVEWVVEELTPSLRQHVARLHLRHRAGRPPAVVFTDGAGSGAPVLMVPEELGMSFPAVVASRSRAVADELQAVSAEIEAILPSQSLEYYGYQNTTTGLTQGPTSYRANLPLVAALLYERAHMHDSHWREYLEYLTLVLPSEAAALWSAHDGHDDSVISAYTLGAFNAPNNCSLSLGMLHHFKLQLHALTAGPLWEVISAHPSLYPSTVTVSWVVWAMQVVFSRSVLDNENRPTLIPVFDSLPHCDNPNAPSIQKLPMDEQGRHSVFAVLTAQTYKSDAVFCLRKLGVTDLSGAVVEPPPQFPEVMLTHGYTVPRDLSLPNSATVLAATLNHIPYIHVSSLTTPTEFGASKRRYFLQVARKKAAAGEPLVTLSEELMLTPSWMSVQRLRFLEDKDEHDRYLELGEKEAFDFVWNLDMGRGIESEFAEGFTVNMARRYLPWQIKCLDSVNQNIDAAITKRKGQAGAVRILQLLKSMVNWERRIADAAQDKFAAIAEHVGRNEAVIGFSGGAEDDGIYDDEELMRTPTHF